MFDDATKNDSAVRLPDDSLKSRLAAFYGKPVDEIYVEKSPEIDTGEPVGEEVW